MDEEITVKEIPFTGERFVPSEQGRIAYEHYHRYAACAQAAAGKIVLDIACGEGFGSALLANRAAKVIGVDIDAATIHHAVEKYCDVKNATFLVGDARAIPLDENSVDLIVSFETIEHIQEHEVLLKEFHRVLRPTGTIIVSSPDRENYSERPGYTNPYHIHELTHEQFVGLFREKFRFVRAYRQRLAIASFLLADEAKGPKLLQSFMAGKHGIEPGSRPLRSSLYSLVVCSNSKRGFRSLASSIHLDAEDDLYLDQERVLRWASGLHEEHEVLKQQIRATDTAYADSKKNDAKANQALKISVETIAKLSQQNTYIEAECRQYASALSQQTAESHRLQTELSHQTAENQRLQVELSRQTAESQRLQTELSRQTVESKQLHTDLSYQVAESAWLQTELSQQTVESQRLQTELSHGVAESGRLQAELSQQTTENRRLQAALSQQTVESKRLQTDLSRQTAEGERMQTGLSRQTAEIQWLRTELWERKTELVLIRNSTSWRLTAPLRFLADTIGISHAVKITLRLIWWTISFQLYRRFRAHRKLAAEKALIEKSELFDVGWYLAQYPDVAKAGTDPLTHYLCRGAVEGRDPYPLFDTDRYLAKYPDVALSGINPLVHYVTHGAAEGRDPRPRFDTDRHLAEYPDAANSGVNPSAHSPRIAGSAGHECSAFCADPNADILAAPNPDGRPLVFPSVYRPAVSVIIPVYGKCEHTMQCLRSLEHHKSKYCFEVIVVDDSSPDDTAKRLDEIDNIVVVSNQSNLGFVRSCNAGAHMARGEFLVFLNNDTVVLDGWLDALIDTFAAHPSNGLVGSKLIYPDRRLQEAGGIIWSDATGWNFGRFDDPAKPEYNYVREADYCSGASIALRHTLFNQLGGFDERYVPAYYEDVDLAFAVRNAGFKVLYQPKSTVVHFEGVTSGTDEFAGVKAFQRVNQRKFAEKWADRLATHSRNGEKWRLARDRLARSRILVIDAVTPTPDRDAGSVMAFYFLKIFADLGHKVTFMPENLQWADRYTETIQQLGIESIYNPHYISHESYLEQYGGDFDIVVLFRAWTAEKFFDIVKKYCPRAKIIFETVDLHYLREEREAKLFKSAELELRAARTKAVEIGMMRKVDETIVVSDVEMALLKSEHPELSLTKIPLVLEAVGSRMPFTQRQDLLFIGGFQHVPNVDAMEFFVAEVWPLLKDRLPDARLLIIGSNMPEKVWALQQYERVVPVGFVEDIGQYLGHCRLTVAPLRFGAGIKGKIASSGASGVPTVATTIAAEGMGLQDGYNILIGDTPDVFADQVVRLYSDEALWNKLSKNVFNLVEESLSVAAAKIKIANLLAKFVHSEPIQELVESDESVVIH